MCFGIPLLFLITQEMNLPSGEYIFSILFNTEEVRKAFFYRNRSFRHMSALLADKFETMAMTQAFFNCTTDFAVLQQSHQMEPSPVFAVPSICNLAERL